MPFWQWSRPRRSTSVALGDLASLPRIYEADITFDGGFKLPTSVSNGVYLTFAPGAGFVKRPGVNKLFTTGGGSSPGNSTHYVAEVNIPTTLVLSSDGADLPTGTFTATGDCRYPGESETYHAYSDSAIPYPEGSTYLFATPCALGIWNDRLIFSEQYMYDSAPNQIKNFAHRPLDLTATGDVTPYTLFAGINDAVGYNCMRASTMFTGVVPPEWVEALGGYPHYCGAGTSYSVVSSQFLGPSLFGFDPALIGATGTQPMQPYVMYPWGHATLGDWDDNPPLTPYFSFSCQYRAGVMIPGTRTFLIAGVNGTDNWCYGPGVAEGNPNLGLPYPPPDGPHFYCLDPTIPDSSNHGWPYDSWVTAYDMLDFAAVVAGDMRAWDVLPYTGWVQSFPIAQDPATTHPFITGYSWDPIDDKLWVGQMATYGVVDGGAGNGAMWRCSVNRG